MKNFYFGFVALVFARCASAPPVPAGPPWVHAPSRVLDGGYIVYVGFGQDALYERANFKADALAIQDVANECSFVPKGTRIEDHFDEGADGGHKIYTKVAVTFEECEAAKRAVNPEAIRALANVTMTAEVKRYQDEFEFAPTTPTSSAVASGTGTLTAGGGTLPAVAPGDMASGPITTEPQFFFVRQEVAYAKQGVILSPASAFAPELARNGALSNRDDPARRSATKF